MKRTKTFLKKAGTGLFLLIQTLEKATAQSAAGIDQATAEVSSYIDPISNLNQRLGGACTPRVRRWFPRGLDRSVRNLRSFS